MTPPLTATLDHSSAAIWKLSRDFNVSCSSAVENKSEVLFDIQKMSIICLLIVICSGFHLTKQWIKASHTLVLVITFFLFLLRVDSVHSHFCQCISQMVFLPLPKSQEWLLYHNMRHRAPCMCFTSFPSAAVTILNSKWRHLRFLVWFGDCGRQL